MFISIAQDDERMFDLLIKHGADPNLLSGAGDFYTPLLFAAEWDKLVFVRKLLALGVEIDISERNLAATVTPLRFSTIRASEELIGVLLDAGAKANGILNPTVLGYRHASARYLLQRGLDVNEQDEMGNTPLMNACITGMADTVQMFLESGKVDLTLKNNAGATALDVADRKDMWECALLVWAAGCESGTLKSAHGLGPVKWHRPRILGYKSTLVSKKTPKSGDNEEEDADNDDEDYPPPPVRYGMETAVIGSSVYGFGGIGFPDEYDMTQFNPDVRSVELESAPKKDFYRLDLSGLKIVSLLPSSFSRTAPLTRYELDKTRIGPDVRIESDGLTATSTVDDEDSTDPSMALANVPFLKEDAFSYFEVEVVNAGPKALIAVGLVEDNACKLDQMPGWIGGTIGYHGDDGCTFHDQGSTCRLWGNHYTHGDVVGTGILWESGEVFFTLNGEFLGVAYRSPWAKQYYAALGLRNKHAQLKTNFGELPFLFDFRAPSLKWERLPSPPKQFEAHEHCNMFTVDVGNTDQPSDPFIVLFAGGFSTYEMAYWVWRQELWHLCKAKGAQPLIFGATSLVSIGDSIYALIHSEDASMKIAYPQQPALLRLKFAAGPSNDDQEGNSADEMVATWQEIFPRPSFYTVPEEHLDNWSQAKDELSKSFKPAKMLAVEGRLCFLGEKSLALLDPETFDIEIKEYKGAVPLFKGSRTTAVGPHVEIFGGWDQNIHRNDVNLLDTRTAEWYHPHTLGICPRPREETSSVLVTVPSEKHLRSMTNFGSSATLHPEGEYSSSYILHAFGWNGSNYIDDFELLSLQHREEADPLVTQIQPIERRDNAGIVNFRLVLRDGSLYWWSTSAIVISARASKWRQQILDSRDKSLTIEVSNVGRALFSAFLKYLHDDRADFEIGRDDTRTFCKLFDSYAPEHSQRVAASLILTRVNIKSRMSDDMSWAFENDLHSDVNFQIEDQTLGLQTIKAHKSILVARSDYFKSLLSGGLLESESDTITINDSDYKSFRMVLYYLYTRNLDLQGVSECISEVFILASKYAITDLRLQLESIFAYNLSPENAVSLLLLGETHNSETLKRTCAEFILAHYEEVGASEDFEQNSELVSCLVESFLESKSP